MSVFSHLPRRAAITYALMLIVGTLMVQAGMEGLSNFYALLANQELNHPSMSERRFREEGGAPRAMHYLTESLHYSSNNAWALEELGVLEIRRLDLFKGPLHALTVLTTARNANAHLHGALLERPTSSFVWANLARSKLSLNERDGELLQALRRADELGPWEPETQKIVIYLSLTVWDRLDPEQQASVVQTMERAAKRDAQYVTNVAKSFNRINLICGIKEVRSAVETADCSPVKNPKQLSAP
jgi:hypothetical protein